MEEPPEIEKRLLQYWRALRLSSYRFSNAQAELHAGRRRRAGKEVQRHRVVKKRSNTMRSIQFPGFRVSALLRNATPGMTRLVRAT
jgi:hypothetical protein